MPLGVANLATAARAVGARLVQISTDYVFDGRLGRPYRPDDATGPLNVYGATKLAGEAAALSLGPAALVVRTAWVYSAAPGNFLWTMASRFAARTGGERGRRSDRRSNVRLEPERRALAPRRASRERCAPLHRRRGRLLV